MSEENKKSTVGAAAVALQKKATSDTHPIVDQAQAQLSEYYDNLIKCVKDNKHKYAGDFYIVVLTKKERLLENVLRNYFFARNTCPTPDYDQSVYYYDAAKEEVSYIWTIPDRETCLILLANAADLPKEEWELLEFVNDFASGKLYKLAKSLNKEKYESVELDN